MKLADIVGMAIHNLIQRRMRTALNLVGIVIGCTTLLMTAAGGQGVGSALHGLLDSSPHAKQMIIRYGYGEEEVPEEFTKVEGDMSEERRARIEAILEEKWRDENIPWTERMITKEQIERIAALPHVTEVITRDWFRSVADGPDGAFLIELQGCSASDREVAERLIAGRMLSGNSTDEILVHEYLAYRLGFRSDASLDALVGTELSLKWGTSRMQLGQMVWALDDQPTGVERFEMQVELAGAIQKLLDGLESTNLSGAQRKLVKRVLMETSQESADEEVATNELSDEEIVRHRTFRVVGVIRGPVDDDFSALLRQVFHSSDVEGLIGYKTLQRMAEDSGEDPYYYHGRVTIDSTVHLAETVRAIEAEGIDVSSALNILERVDREIDRVTFAIYGLAFAILLIACFGISNTLVISVVERTPEFGIMKSLGATDGHILRLMIVEGATLGVIGAGLSLVTAYGLSMAGDGLLKNYVETRVADTLNSGLFHFSPLWMCGITAVSVSVCVVASLVPAWRASRLDPVVAMRRT